MASSFLTFPIFQVFSEKVQQLWLAAMLFNALTRFRTIHIRGMQIYDACVFHCLYFLGK